MVASRLLVACSSMLLLGGCFSLHGARSADVKIGPAGLTPGQLQLQVMGFADLYSDAISQAMEDSWTSGMPTQTRARMLELNLGGLEAAMRIAASPNPFTGLLDMTVMVSLQKLVWEEYWVPEVFQEQGYDMLAALEMLEREAWEIADDALSPDQVQAVRDMVVEVRKRYPHQVFVANLRASEIAADRAQSQLDVAGEGSFLSLFALDPLASLTPATRELAQTRLFAERTFFYASRMPILIRWEALLLIDNVVSLPEARSAMESIDRTSRALEQGVQVAQDLETQLPAEREAAINQIADRLSQQREAMISQVFSGITAERQSILAALDDEQLRLRGTLTDLRSTVEATSQLSNSLQTTIHSAKKLVGTLQGEPSTDSTARPFDINEYRAVAESTADAVRELNKGLTSVQDLLASPAWSQRESQLKAVGVEGRTLLHAAIDQLFWRALLVVALATVGLFVALAAARLVPSKTRSVG